MKYLLSFVQLFGLLAISYMVASCSSDEARFAKDVSGLWQGTLETFSDNSATTATIIDIYDFSPASMTANKVLSGPVTVTGMVNTTTRIGGNDALAEPLSLSASAVTSISGTWTVVDNDEIALSFNPQSLVVDIDPDGVVDNNNPMSSPAVDSIRPKLCKTLEHNIRTALTTRYAAMRHMDDVKIKGVLFKYESDHEDFVLTRQSK